MLVLRDGMFVSNSETFGVYDVGVRLSGRGKCSDNLVTMESNNVVMRDWALCSA